MSSHCEKSSPKENNNDPLRSCKVCGSPSTSFCRNCTVAYYCSREHQKLDWKTHKKTCYPVKLGKTGERTDEILDLIATREISSNEVFLKEGPILVFPHSSSQTPDVCLECCSPIDSEDEDKVAVSCPRCDWRLCCAGCVNGKYHEPNECKLFSERGIKPTSLNSEEVDQYFLIGMIRALLLEHQNKEKWEVLKTLNNYKKQRDARPELKNLLEPYVSFIRNDCGLDKFDEELIGLVFGVLKGNSVDVSDYNSMAMRNVSLLFPRAMQVGPKCVPNARFSIHGLQTNNFVLYMVSNVGISQGAPISISFEQGLTSTFIRRSLKERLFFRDCTCERCCDPTELGSFLGAMKCRKCKTGYILQTKPTLPLESQWKCSKCEEVVGDEAVAKLIQDTSSEMQTAGSDPTLAGMESLLKCISKLKRELLHPNHFIVVNGEIDVCKRVLGLSNMSNVTEKGTLMIEMGRHLLTMADILAPGYSRLRGHVLFYIQFGLFNEALKSTRMSMRMKPKEGLARARKKSMEECKTYQEEIQQIFKHEPEESEEFVMLSGMESGREMFGY